MAYLYEGRGRNPIATAEGQVRKTELVTPYYRLVSEQYQFPSPEEARKWQVFLTGLGIVRQKISRLANDPLSRREFSKEEAGVAVQDALATVQLYKSLSEVITGRKIDPLTKTAVPLTDGERDQLYAHILAVEEESDTTNVALQKISPLPEGRAASSGILRDQVADILRQDSSVDFLDQSADVVPQTTIKVESERDLRIITMLFLSLIHDAAQPIAGMQLAEFLTPKRLEKYSPEEARRRMESKMVSIDKQVARVHALVAERSERFNTIFSREAIPMDDLQMIFQMACLEASRRSEDEVSSPIKISFSSETQENALGANAVGNPYWLGELARNMINNTQKAYQNSGLQPGETGNLHVAFGTRVTKRGREYVEIIVDDDGVGYPKSLLKRKRFADNVGGWNDPSTPSHREGMFLQHCILEAHGGILGIGENPQGGARTTIYLPLASND